MGPGIDRQPPLETSLADSEKLAARVVGLILSGPEDAVSLHGGGKENNLKTALGYPKS